LFSLELAPSPTILIRPLCINHGFTWEKSTLYSIYYRLGHTIPFYFTSLILVILSIGAKNPHYKTLYYYASSMYAIAKYSKSLKEKATLQNFIGQCREVNIIFCSYYHYFHCFNNNFLGYFFSCNYFTVLSGNKSTFIYYL